jgi:hypothetical protein
MVEICGAPKRAGKSITGWKYGASNGCYIKKQWGYPLDSALRNM